MTHSSHGLLVKGEGNVGTAVLVTGAGVAFGRRWQGVGGPALAQAQTGPHKALVVTDGDAALI